MNCFARRSFGWALVATAIVLLAPQVSLAQQKVLRLKLDGPVLEVQNDNAELLALLGGESSTTLYGLVSTIRSATDDRGIAGIALILESPSVGLPQAEEITRALREFRDTGRKVYCYTDYAGNVGFALACACDHIMVAENSMLAVTGLYGEASYYKGLLDKIGVQADMLHCGAYKSALEPYTRTGPSPEAAENINWLLDGLYERWIELIAAGRGLDESKVRELVDQGPLSSEAAYQAELVDQVGTFNDFTKLIHKEYGQDVDVVKELGGDDEFELDFENPFAIFQMIGEMMEAKSAPRDPGIALFHINGTIMTGRSDSSPFGGAVVGSTTIRAAFEEVRNDPEIKAVVVRVDSPGGSAIASDIMWKAATRCAEEKPLVVSMGRVAGSGGYYVAIPGDRIFAEATTITGSIGVVGGKFVWQDLMENKLGITTTEFQRGAHAALFSMNRPWNESERAWMQDFMNETYEQFKGRVLKSRGDRLKGNLEDMAGGRVYTGRQALELGLIDEIGGESDAIAYAAKKAGLVDYEVYVYPEPKSFEDVLASILGKETKDDWEIRMGAQLAGDPLTRRALPLLQDLAPQRVGDVLNALRGLVTLQHEHVGCYMPFELHVR